MPTVSGQRGCDRRVYEANLITRWLRLAYGGSHEVAEARQMVGNPDDDLLTLLGRLSEEIGRVLSVKHLTDGDREPHQAVWRHRRVGEATGD